jgi:hypothetical protein
MTVKEYDKLDRALEILNEADRNLSSIGREDGETPSEIRSAMTYIDHAYAEVIQMFDGGGLETCSDYKPIK